jgi:hypothetical protein
MKDCILNKRNCAFLAAAISCFTSLPAMSSQTGSNLTLGNWAAVCDNGWRCEALLANSEPSLNSSASVQLARDGGPGGLLRLSIFPSALSTDGTSFVPKGVDALSSSIKIPTLPHSLATSGDNAITFEGDTAAALIKTMLEDDSLRIFADENKSITLNTRGLMAVLVYFDTVQQRIGNESALLANGSKASDATPSPPQIPSIKTPKAAPAPPSTLSQEQVRKERATFDCGRNQPRATMATGVDYFRLDARTTLAVISPPCLLGNYNSFGRIVLVDEEGTPRLAQIERDNPEAKLAEGLAGAYWDKTTRRLISFGRWNSRCGSGEAYVWDGEKFRIVEENATASCDLEIFQPLISWRATVLEE